MIFSHSAINDATWRNTFRTVLVPSPCDFTLPRSVEEQRKAVLTSSLIPKLTAVTPNPGTYLNEADFHLGIWFYGANCARFKKLFVHYMVPRVYLRCPTAFLTILLEDKAEP